MLLALGEKRRVKFGFFYADCDRPKGFGTVGSLRRGQVRDRKSRMRSVRRRSTKSDAHLGSFSADEAFVTTKDQKVS